MRFRPHPSMLLTVLAALMAAGCQVPGGGSVAPTMRIGMVDSGAPEAIVRVDGRPANRAVSELTITVRAESLLARRVLATVADVERVEVLVEVADGSEFTATVTKAQFTAGTVSVTFPAVPVGTASVTLTAYDATDKVIGTASQPATVVAGTSTPVNVSLTLNPTAAAPSSGGSGTTTTPPVGGVVINGTITDGPTLPAGVLAMAVVPIVPSDYEVDPKGRAWIAGEEFVTGIGRFRGFDADGQEIASIDAENSEIGGIAFDQDDHLYVTVGPYMPFSSRTFRYQVDDWSVTPVEVASSPHGFFSAMSGKSGHVWAGLQLVTGPSPFVSFQYLDAGLLNDSMPYDHSLATAVGANGDLWAADLVKLLHVSAADGSYVTVPTPLDGIYAATPDESGDIWVVGRIGDLPAPRDLDEHGAPHGNGSVYLLRLKPDGTIASQVKTGDEPPYSMCIGPMGDVYYALRDQGKVVKYSTAGTLLKTYDLPSPAWVGSGGSHVWTASLLDTVDQGLYRLDP